MIVFELSMPNRGSWNGEWSQYGSLFVRTLRERDVPKECWGKSFCYSWEDGWTACVTVTRMTASEARRLEQKSNGFCGYDWMIRSIIKHGDIRREVIAMKKMAADEAYAKHIEMWTAMQKELGDNPTYSNREDFKRAWVRKHGETVLNSCYLCQYNLETGNIHCGKNCLVDWGGGCLIGKTSYATSPISEILALPRREENDG